MMMCHDSGGSLSSVLPDGDNDSLESFNETYFCHRGPQGLRGQQGPQGPAPVVDFSLVNALDTGVGSSFFPLFIDEAGVETGVNVKSLSDSFRFSADKDTVFVGGLSADNISAVSDESLKKNVILIKDALSKILSMRGVSFEFANDDFGDKLVPCSVGFIAQELEKILPEVVSVTGSGGRFKAVSYENIVALHNEGIKELLSEFSGLEKDLEELERLIESFES